MTRIAALVAAAIACGACYRSASTPPATGAPAPAATPRLPTTFDGFAIGDSFASVMARDPYRRPCDDDPIEDRRARAMVYAAFSCHGSAFPDDTSVVFIIGHAPDDDYARPIRAFGWMGPYYDDKVKLPARFGDPVARATAAFGKPTASFDLRTLHVDQFPGVTVLSDHGTIVGFAFGELPPDPDLERWDGFDQMYRKYTPRPGKRNLSVADCLAVFRHAAKLEGDDPDEAERRLREDERFDREIDECRRRGTPEMLGCALAATTPAELQKCE